jgi:hypothetical protein
MGDLLIGQTSACSEQFCDHAKEALNHLTSCKNTASCEGNSFFSSEYRAALNSVLLFVWFLVPGCVSYRRLLYHHMNCCSPEVRLFVITVLVLMIPLTCLLNISSARFAAPSGMTTSAKRYVFRLNHCSLIHPLQTNVPIISMRLCSLGYFVVFGLIVRIQCDDGR